MPYTTASNLNPATLSSEELGQALPSYGRRTSTARARARRVLIADDNVDIAESLAILLRLEGYDVTVVHDGRCAVDAIQSGPAFDFALLDIGMPIMDGYEVARSVRADPPKQTIRLIAISGWGQPSDVACAFNAGFDHHFTKPVEPNALCEVLSRTDYGGAGRLD